MSKIKGSSSGRYRNVTGVGVRAVVVAGSGVVTEVRILGMSSGRYRSSHRSRIKGRSSGM